MSVAGELNLEIIDLANTQGSPVLTWSYSEGGMNGVQATYFYSKFQNPVDKATIPIVLRGIGASLSGSANKLEDAGLYAQIYTQSGLQFTTGNNNWQTSTQALKISGRHLQPVNLLDAALALTVLDGEQFVITSGSGYFYGGSRRARTDIIRNFYPEFRDINVMNSGTQAAWLSYDVSSGATNKQIFAYSLELLQKISGASGVNLQTSGDYFTPSRLLYYSGFRYSGQCEMLNLILDETGVTCTLPPELEDSDEPIEACLPSGLSSGQITQRINQILSLIYRQQTEMGISEGDAVDNSAISSSPTSLHYHVYKGIIEYNTPYSGDYFCVTPYSYDYTGTYSGIYSGAPPYPQPQICFLYPQDYTTITGLVSKINARLSGSGYNLWNRDICNPSTRSGYFESGGLLKATQSGANFIEIEALREGALGGYQFTFFAASRPLVGLTRQNSLKYLLPRKVSLQGATTYGNWTTLHSESGIQWGKVRPTVVRQNLYDFYTGFSTGSGGVPNSIPSAAQAAISGSPVKRLVYEAAISGFNHCRLPFYKEVQFYEVATGFRCLAAGDSDDFTDQGTLVGAGGAETGLYAKPVDYTFLKTGWKCGNTGVYNYYRIYLEDFRAEGQGENVQLTDSFYINGINFFGIESGVQVLSASTCLLGASYVGRISGLCSGLLTGTFTADADSYGKLCLSQYRITGTPNGNGQVSFFRYPGLAIGPFTGLVTACVTGTGFYTESVGGYYYNSGLNCVSFTQPVSGFITGSGQLLGGPYAIIRDEVIGYLSGNDQTVSGYEAAVLTGIIPNFSTFFAGLDAFAYSSGYRTGLVLAINSGVLSFVETISEIPAVAYSTFLSGTRAASIILTYNSPFSGDTIFINNAPIVYSGSSGDSAPTYFNSISQLTNIINSGSASFLCTGYNDGTNIYLISTQGGVSGNGIATTTSGAGTKPTFSATGFSGGQNIYYNLTAYEVFNGSLSMDLYAVEYKVLTGSGVLTGRLKQLDFIRYFTGLWNIQSGDIDFRTTGWITGNGTRYQNSGFALPLQLYSGRPDAFPLLISYTNDPLVPSLDFARLIITGFGTNTGISMILSGQI